MGAKCEYSPKIVQIMGAGVHTSGGLYSDPTGSMGKDGYGIFAHTVPHSHTGCRNDLGLLYCQLVSTDSNNRTDGSFLYHCLQQVCQKTMNSCPVTAKIHKGGVGFGIQS